MSSHSQKNGMNCRLMPRSKMCTAGILLIYILTVYRFSSLLSKPKVRNSKVNKTGITTHEWHWKSQQCVCCIKLFGAINGSLPLKLLLVFGLYLYLLSVVVQSCTEEQSWGSRYLMPLEQRELQVQLNILTCGRLAVQRTTQLDNNTNELVLISSRGVMDIIFFVLQGNE